MQTIIEFTSSYLFPIIIIGVGVLFAFVFDKIILRKLAKMAANTEWEGDDILIKALRNISILPIVVMSIYWASFHVDISDFVHQKIEKYTIVVMLSIFTIMMSRIAVGFVRLLPGRSSGAFPGSSIFINITRITIFILGFVFILQQLGISITPIITALGVGGLAVALALQDTLANLFAGLNVIAGRRLKQGDFIQLENGQDGLIEDITWRSTVIREQTNNHIIVPNTKLASSVIKNYSTPVPEVFVIVKIGVDYQADLEKIELLILQAAKRVIQSTSASVSDFEPFVRYKEFADHSIDADVFLKAKSFVDRLELRHLFIKELQTTFKQEGISIPFPTRTLHITSEQS
ncbi:MAG: mechanosensitive ion channel family protein [Cytophagales bacterium]|nr:MAG: mechanosensitive ion channel family protein [Cytophagales bacterium]